MSYIYSVVACLCGWHFGETKFEQAVVYALIHILLLIGSYLDKLNKDKRK